MKKSTSQKEAVSWDNAAREGAAEVRKHFREKKVEMVLAGDEFFQQYHAESGQVFSPERH